MRKLHLTAALAGFAVITVAAGPLLAATKAAGHYEGEELASQASLTKDEALAIALKAQAGTVKKTELEKEDGGSGLRYTFDIRAGQTTFEVGVDAKTGAVLEHVKAVKDHDHDKKGEADGEEKDD
ncbi:PepSY domain-containing protein [Asticcacaulis sp.]|uniref:PepSY domain-containing protein n=1 Tax=Asticcacaulis sp. TaxID=1872648 RepID=UPI0031D41BD9